MKRFLSMLLVLAMVLACTPAVPVDVQAVENTQPEEILSAPVTETEPVVPVEETEPALPETVIASGTCGSNAQWSLDTVGTLRIYGTGSVSSSGSSAPWYTYRAQIKNIIVADTITGMPSGAFYGLSSLGSITIPFVGGSKKTSSNTYQYPFGYIFGTSSYTGGVATTQYYYGSSTYSTTSSTYYIPRSLKSVTVTGGNILYGAFYNCSNLISVTIGEDVESIGSSAFSSCSGLTSVVIPDRVKSIGSYAFYCCSSLTSIVIPDSVTSIGDYAFDSCSSLTSVVIPDSVTSIGSNAFSFCSSLESVVIPDSVTSIGDAAFYYCSSLTSVVIPDSVTSIGGSAFSYCNSLTSVEIPDSVTSISDYAFCNCSSLTGIWVDADNTAYCSDEQGVLYNKNKTTLIQAPGGITECTIADSVTSIGSFAFEACSSLTSVVIPDSVTSIGSRAFEACSSLTSIEIPDSVTSIGSRAFEACSSLTSIEIPDSVTSIGGSAFENCSGLTSVVIGDSVTSIGGSAFENCSSLESVVIPDSVTSIGYWAFYKCSGLTSVVIGDSVTSIGDSAFRDCSSLRHVAYTGTQSKWNSISISSYYNSDLTAATRHYETRFDITDNCVESSVYCPVCQVYITRTEKEGGAHSYTDGYDVSCNACDFNRTVTGISISRFPEKLGYLLFEDLDLTGGMVLVAFSDGSTGEVALTEQMVTGFDPATIGQQQLTVSYGGMTTTFMVEVLAQMPDSVELLTKPSMLSYIVGDTLDITGLTLKAIYGEKAAVVTASSVIAQADMTTPGIKTVTVTFGKSTTFEIYVHEGGTVTVDSSLYPESSHDYSNNVNETKTLTVPGATQLVLTFNSSSYTESNYDYVYVLDGAGNQIAKYTGSLANKVVTVPGDTVKIKLTSDGSRVQYGYKFSSIQAEFITHPETAVPGYAPTCTEPGLSDGTVCAICGETVTQQVEIPATGHDTVDGVCQNCDFGKNVVHILSDAETYYSTFEGALANATGGTIKLLADATVDTVVLKPGVTLDLNGHTLTADVLIALNGAAVTDGGTACTGGGLLKVAKNSLMMGAENGYGVIPVWNGVDGYVFTKVTFQQMAVKAGAGAAQYIFLPTFSNKAAAALMADGGTDNGLKFKVGLTWSDGQCQQFYTYSDDLVKQVFDGTGRWVFSLTVTGIAGITDMVASAVVVTNSYAQATATDTALTAG